MQYNDERALGVPKALFALIVIRVQDEYNIEKGCFPLKRPNPMTQIILNDDQVQAVRQGTDPVEVCDPSGVLVGYVTRRVMATPEEIAEAKRRAASPGPWHTTEQFLARLQALEE
jgi:hypothetical protein